MDYRWFSGVLFSVQATCILIFVDLPDWLHWTFSESHPRVSGLLEVLQCGGKRSNIGQISAAALWNIISSVNIFVAWPEIFLRWVPVHLQKSLADGDPDRDLVSVPDPEHRQSYHVLAPEDIAAVTTACNACYFAPESGQNHVNLQ